MYLMKTMVSVLLSTAFLVPLFAMQRPEIAPVSININEIENQSTKNVKVVGSRGIPQWDIAPGSEKSSYFKQLNISLDSSRPDLTIISHLGQIRLGLMGNNLQLTSPKGTVPLSSALYRNSKIVVRPNGFIELISSNPAPQQIISVDRPVAPISKLAAAPASKAVYKVYKSLADFILDDNPHQLTKEESTIVADYENWYMGNNWVDSFWIGYNDLRNDDGSALSPVQKKSVVTYLKKNSQHADDNGFRFANNNYEVLGGPAGQNPVWKLMHNYLRSLPCLINRLKKIGSGPCPTNKAQSARN